MEGKIENIIFVLKVKRKICYNLLQLRKPTMNFTDTCEICYIVQFCMQKLSFCLKWSSYVRVEVDKALFGFASRYLKSRF